MVRMAHGERARAVEMLQAGMSHRQVHLLNVFLFVFFVKYKCIFVEMCIQILPVSLLSPFFLHFRLI